MSVAFLFPGQGSKNLLAALDRAASTARGRALLDRAANAAGVPRGDLAARGGRALDRTEVLQPVLTAIALAAHGDLVDAGVVPGHLLGHSLGEVAASAAAGEISAEDAVEVAAHRGRLMAREAARAPGGMLAMSGEPDAARALAVAETAWIAAWNAPDEVVIAGPADALAAVAARVPCKRLDVPGAWHGPAMSGAVADFHTQVRSLGIGEALASRFAEALVKPVRFSDALARLGAATTFVTAGPGAVLRSLVRRNLGASVRVLGTETPADLGRTVAALRGAA